MANVPVTMTVSAKGVDATTAALEQVTRSMDRMRKMQTQAVAVGNILANVVTRGARQVQALARESLAGADGIAKSARAFGLSAQGYQELAFASRRSGIEVGALNVALRTMSQRMVSSGTYANKLGISFDHLKGLSPEKQLAEVGKAIATIKDPAERTAVAVDMFGRHGARIAQMAGDFESLAAEAHNLGVIMNDGALKTAEQFNDMMGDIKARMQAVFVNALPDIALFGKVLWAELKRGYDVAVAVTTALFRMFSPDNLQVMGENFKTFFTWLGDNWRDIAYNMGETLSTVFLNSFENLKRLVTAAKTWIGGGGWDFKSMGLMEGANLRNIEGPQFKKLPAIEELKGDLGKAANDYAARIAKAEKERADAFNDGLGGIDPNALAGAINKISPANAPDRTRGLEAATFGSIEAARAISRMREGGGNIEQKQLTMLERIERNTAESADGIEIAEYAIP